MDLRRVKIEFIGGPGGLKVSTMYTSDASGARDSLVAFWNAIRVGLPSLNSVTVAAEGDIIDSETGLISGTWTEGTATALAGSSANVFAAGVGLCVTWKTAAVIEGRRVRGRTFLVPISTDQYDGTGTIKDTFLTTCRNAADTYRDDGFGYVFSRPRTVPLLPGSAVPITVATINDKVAFLSSRRQ